MVDFTDYSPTRSTFLWKIGDTFCPWKVIPITSHDYHLMTPFDKHIRRNISLLPGPQLISELVPHYIQCFLILLMSIERYILVCHSATAKFILTHKRRYIFYATVTCLLSLLTVFVIFAHLQDFKTTTITNDVLFSLYDSWTVRNHSRK